MTLTPPDFWMPTGQDLFRCAPELALVGTIVVILIAPLIVGRSARITGTIVLVGILLAVWRWLAPGRAGWPHLTHPRACSSLTT